MSTLASRGEVRLWRHHCTKKGGVSGTRKYNQCITKLTILYLYHLSNFKWLILFFLQTAALMFMFKYIIICRENTTTALGGFNYDINVLSVSPPEMASLANREETSGLSPAFPPSPALGVIYLLSY